LNQRPLLGAMLVAAGKLSSGQLEEIIASQKGTGKRLGALVVERGIITELELTQILSNQLSVAWVSLEYVDFTDEILDVIPGELARKYTLIPVHYRVDEHKEPILYVAMDDPTDIEAMKKVSEFSGTHVRPMIAPLSEIKRAIELYYTEDRESRRFPF
jgi:type IV pilus assembly protein PilB